MYNTPTLLNISIHIIVFIYGVLIGSFLNVVICRLPRKESIVKVRSHCEGCGYQLKWYDLVPLFSYIFLRGKCRKCKAVISIQHPLIEGLNGLFYIIVFTKYGFSIDTVLFCLLSSALLALSVIDFRTYEIPVGFQYVIGILAVIRVAFHYQSWIEHVIGFFAVSLFLCLIYYISKGTAIGGGDVKLMAVCGLMLGWKLILFAFIVGCILGSVIHLLRMKISKEDHVLAMGPYLSAGIMIAILWGEQFVTWYVGTWGL